MTSSLSKNGDPLISLQNIPVPSTKVYVCFLPSDMTENVLQKMFERFGKILSLKLLKRKDGFTYSHIIYEKIEQAKIAIKTMNRLQIQDKFLKVNFAAQVDKKSQVKEKDELILKEKKQQIKSFAKLLLQKMPSKKKKKKSKIQNKQMKYEQKIENKTILQPLPIQTQKEIKQTNKSIIREQKKQQVQIKNIKLSKQVQKIGKYQLKQLIDQQDTQAEWSQDFDPADLKKKPISFFIL